MKSLIDSDGKISSHFIEMAKSFGVHIPKQWTPSEINGLLQQLWVHRGKHEELVHGTTPNEEQLAALRRLGFVTAVPVPNNTGKNFDGALLLGSNLFLVRHRLQYLLNEYRRGDFEFTKLFVLGSQRELNPFIEHWDALFDVGGIPLRHGWQVLSNTPLIMPRTETEMMRTIIDQSNLPLQWEVVFIDSQDVPTSSGGKRNANTGDTIAEWLKVTNSVQGRYLMVASQSSLSYQELTVKRLLPPKIEIFTIGPEALPTEPIARYLDNVAKRFYEEELAWKKRRV